jgi:hypothetical protein
MAPPPWLQFRLAVALDAKQRTADERRISALRVPEDETTAAYDA